MHEAVANHFSLAVNDRRHEVPDEPNQVHFSRIRASELLLIDANDPETMNRPNAPDPTAWGLHGAIHRNVPHARCLMHVHSIHATVLASLADSLPAARRSELRPCSTGGATSEWTTIMADLPRERRGALLARCSLDPKAR